jgi:predicted nuclease of predicted toxin-antitoxin system
LQLRGAELPPSLALNLRRTFAVDASHVFGLDLVKASDRKIFELAGRANAVVVTKDSDFVRLLELEGPPPKVLWLTIGNVSNDKLWEVIEQNWTRVLALFEAGEALVEIGRRV